MFTFENLKAWRESFQATPTGGENRKARKNKNFLKSKFKFPRT